MRMLTLWLTEWRVCGCKSAGYKLAELPEPTGEDFQKAVSVLLPYLLSHRTRLAASLPPDTASSTDEVNSTRSSRGAVGAAASMQQAQPAAVEAAGGEEAGAAHAAGEARDGGGAAEASGMSAEQSAQLAEAVDTAILKVLVAWLGVGAPRMAGSRLEMHPSAKKSTWKVHSLPGDALVSS